VVYPIYSKPVMPASAKFDYFNYSFPAFWSHFPVQSREVYIERKRDDIVSPPSELCLSRMAHEICSRACYFSDNLEVFFNLVKNFCFSPII
jgi:hypothetical protein